MPCRLSESGVWGAELSMCSIAIVFEWGLFNHEELFVFSYVSHDPALLLWLLHSPIGIMLLH